MGGETPYLGRTVTSPRPTNDPDALENPMADIEARFNNGTGKVISKSP